MDKKIVAIIDKYSRDRGQLISILQDIQTEYFYLSKEALIQVSKTMGVPISQIYGLATFFRAFSLKPRGRHLVDVCLGTACHVRGGARVLDSIERSLGIGRGETTEDKRFTLETVNCMGCCAVGPAIRVDGQYFGQLSTDKVDSVLNEFD